MKAVIKECPWLQSYLDSLTEDITLTSEQENSLHPHLDIIHRKAQVHVFVLDRKKFLGHARKQEFTRNILKDDQKYWEVTMDKHKMGLSCTKSCEFRDLTLLQMVYPYKLLEENIDDRFIHRNEDSVSICGIECKTYKCYHRSIMKSSTRTVGQALQCQGKDDDFLLDGIDSKFSCFWDSNEHCTLCLRKGLEFTKSAINVDPFDQSIMFSDSIFDRNRWDECNYFGVRVVSILFILVAKKTTLEAEMVKLSENQQSILMALIIAFHLSVNEEPELTTVLDDMIIVVFYLTSLNELTSAQSETIIQFIDFYECEIFGIKRTWSENLRPILLSNLSST